MPIEFKTSGLSPELAEQAKKLQEVWNKKPEEIDEMCDSGMFNSIIKGYALLTLDELGLTEEYGRRFDTTLSDVFNFKSAADARKRTEL